MVFKSFGDVVTCGLFINQRQDVFFVVREFELTCQKCPHFVDVVDTTTQVIKAIILVVIDSNQ